MQVPASSRHILTFRACWHVQSSPGKYVAGEMNTLRLSRWMNIRMYAVFFPKGVRTSLHRKSQATSEFMCISMNFRHGESGTRCARR